jgi:hypothetical protein
MSSQPSDRVAVVATVDPQTVANAEKLTDAVDMSLWHEAMFVCLLGDMAAETIDFKVKESDAAAGSYAALKSASQLAAHASSNDNKQIVINVKAEELTAGRRYLKGSLVTGGATGGPACVVALGLNPRHAPASDDDLADVVEIVS